jgi:hypothetical protein
MRSDDGARFVNDLALAACGTTFAQQAAVVAVRHEADLLTLGLLCRDEAARSSYLAHLRLRHAAQRETRPRDCGTVESVQEVGLVLLGIDSGTQSPGAPVIRDGAAGIVPRSNRVTPKERTPLTNERAELHRRVAANAGAWRLTALIRRHKGLQDRIGKLLLEILNMERDAEMIGNATRIIGGVKGAAALAMTVTLVGGAMQAHPYAHHFMTCFNQECGSDR